jgi:hypothetical protein
LILPRALHYSRQILTLSLFDCGGRFEVRGKKYFSPFLLCHLSLFSLSRLWRTSATGFVYRCKYRDSQGTSVPLNFFFRTRSADKYSVPYDTLLIARPEPGNSVIRAGTILVWVNYDGTWVDFTVRSSRMVPKVPR